MKLLCISNGHGEDVIALRILNALQRHASALDQSWQISALPISGTGRVYQSNDIPIIGPVKTLPSGGFLNRDLKQLSRDVNQGLLSLTRQQLRAITTWANGAASPSSSSTQNSAILAVGDIVPLLFARLSKQPYHFIGTAKSEYWLRDERGKIPASNLTGKLEGWSGSVYLPWERWLMSSDRCQSIFVRDTLTAQYLQKLGIHATYAGNPMMDSLTPTGALTPLLKHLQHSAQNTTQRQTAKSPSASPTASSKATALYVTPKQQPTHPLIITLLPGSRPPEAYQNWQRILTAIPSLSQAFSNRSLILLGAIAPSLSHPKLTNPLTNSHNDTWTPLPAPYPTFSQKNVTLSLINNAYSDCLHESEIAIATAGTATEQFVGLGKPAITLPGPGPQFTNAFATVQAKMLGPSIQLLKDPTQTGETIKKILSDPDRLQLIYQNGTHRMGQPGAADRIAQKLLEAMN